MKRVLALWVPTFAVLTLMATAWVDPARSSPNQSSRSGAAAVIRTYDSVTDTTFIGLKSLELVDDTGQPTGLTLRVFASFPGDVRRDPVISLGLISASRNWHYSGDTERLVLTLDGGTLIKLGPVRVEWTTTTDGSVFQQIWAETTLDVLQTLGRATRVQGLLGRSRFVLNAEQLDALRALATELSRKT